MGPNESALLVWGVLVDLAGCMSLRVDLYFLRVFSAAYNTVYTRQANQVYRVTLKYTHIVVLPFYSLLLAMPELSFPLDFCRQH